ncbi:hypothetical protein AXFE_30470 [Acidithrix ferrooxidans]|uniref:Uncharacterized protein n=1 Tax=Acidithrix ferrooxidans TaxID=1280514 RepID=A0A0D8HGA0_9ACTN|nr:hypothetical protein AXFE_30470 [Acidithrix ferrooxidans]
MECFSSFVAARVIMESILDFIYSFMFFSNARLRTKFK